MKEKREKRREKERERAESEFVLAKSWRQGRWNSEGDANAGRETDKKLVMECEEGEAGRVREGWGDMAKRVEEWVVSEPERERWRLKMSRSDGDKKELKSGEEPGEWDYYNI